MASGVGEPATLSRRTLLAAGLAGAAGPLLWPAGGRAEDPATDAIAYHGITPGTEGDLPLDHAADLPAVAPEALRRRPSLGGATLFYEVNRAPIAFTFEDEFFGQLTTWRNRLGSYVPSSWGGDPSRIYSYGAYVNKPGYHGRGRAFDIASVYFTTRRGTLVKRFDCRYDQWRRSSSRARIREHYWALAASLHHRFRHVLTYLYDADHYNHIHVDNAVYGRYQDAMFSPSSSSQVQHVQACCRYVWDLSTSITSKWNAQTRRHSTAVLRRMGIDGGTIVDSNYNWRMFNHGTLQRGTRKQMF